MPDVVVVGGGLSGLALTHHLHAAGKDVMLVEARGRLGGRIHALHDAGHAFDLGPSWYWPHQPRMGRLADALGLTTFHQHAQGDVLFEPPQGAVQRGAGFASMEGSFRIEGGMIALINRIAATLPADKVRLKAKVTSVDRTRGVTLADGSTIDAQHIIITCPPRVAGRITYLPEIDRSALAAIPTWMGGQAKFIATYDTPFWRDAGLSGDVMSRRGPLVEIHDASPKDGQLGALFGFVGVPTDVRTGQADAIISAAVDQLARCFGDAARTPRKTHVEDWAPQPETATVTDHHPMTSHPAYGLPATLNGLWDGRLQFGSTETARDFGGYLEGALARADELARGLIGHPASG